MEKGKCNSHSKGLVPVLKASTFYQRKEKLLLPAINIPSNLFTAKQGQSLTLTTDFSRNRKAKLELSVNPPHKTKNVALSCQQPNQARPKLFDSRVCVVPKAESAATS